MQPKMVLPLTTDGETVKELKRRGFSGLTVTKTSLEMQTPSGMFSFTRGPRITEYRSQCGGFLMALVHGEVSLDPPCANC
jgi:hypothetical protein